MKSIISKITIYTILLAAFAAFASCGTEEIRTDLTLEEWADNYLVDYVEDEKLQGGLSAMIYKDGEILFSGGTGMADRAQGLNIDASTPMPVGSISKIFTSVALMTLVEEGKVDLDTPAGIYLPRLKLDGEYEMKFTVRDLLTHHSGIPGDLFADWFDTDKDHLYELLADRPMFAEPGELFSYANTGFTLLGLIIEEVSGTSFEQYVRNEIFVPAGMSNSYVHPGEANEPLPRGYFSKSDISVPLLREVPAGGFIVSADDMGRFIAALYKSEDILREETLNSMLTAQNRDNAIDRDFEIGLGFWLIDPMGTGELTASHGGDLPPYHSLLITLPEKELAVFVSTNDNGKGGAIALETGLAIVEEVLDREGIARLNNRAGDVVALSDEQMDSYGGLYGTLAGLIELKPADGYLKMKLGRIPLVLEKRENGMYKPQFKLFNLITIPIPQLADLELDLYEADDNQWMGLWMKGVYLGTSSKLGDVSYTDDYAALKGAYKTPGGTNRLEDGSYAISDISIRERAGRYTLNMKLLGQSVEMALRPSGEGRAVTDGTGRAMGDLVRFETSENGDVTVFWSGFELDKED